jgi:phosphoenolpyruvate carboxykinase (GTP)
MECVCAGWTVRCVSENMAWLRQGADGRLYATNPESGFFGVATGTSQFNNLSLMVAMRKGTNIFVNAALTPEGDVWWEGKTKEAPAQLEDWRGQAWTPASATPAAHPNARYTFPAANCPVMDEAWRFVANPSNSRMNVGMSHCSFRSFQSV